jgi:hypothetical protein
MGIDTDTTLDVICDITITSIRSSCWSNGSVWVISTGIIRVWVGAMRAFRNNVRLRPYRRDFNKKSDKYICFITFTEVFVSSTSWTVHHPNELRMPIPRASPKANPSTKSQTTSCVGSQVISPFEFSTSTIRSMVWMGTSLL